MKFVFRLACCCAAASSLGARQIVQSDFFVVNAGLTKALDAPAPTAVAFSRDGSMLATVDKTGFLCLYSSSGAAQGKAPAHSAGKAAVACSPFGDIVATWGADQKVILWDPKGPTQIRSIASVGKPGVLAFSGDETKIACGGDDGTIKVFAVNGGSPVSSYKAHSKSVLALAFEPSGNSIVSVGADRNMTTAQAANGQVTKQKFMPVKVKFDARPEDEFQQIRSASCTPDGSIFAVGGYNMYRQMGGMPVTFEFVVLYDRSGRRLVQIGDKTMLNLSLGVSISPDAKLVATSAPNGMMRIWDVQHNQLCGQIVGQGGIRQTAATKVGATYYFGVAGNTATLVGVTSVEAQSAPAAEQPKASNEGLSIDFAAPSEPSPIVSTQNVEVTAIVSGLKGKPRYTVEIAGEKSEPGDLQVSDNKELVLAPAPGEAGKAAAAAAVQVNPDTIRISQNLSLSEGPNRVKVTVQDGSNQVTAVKTICYVPDLETLDKSKLYGKSYAILIGVNRYQGKSGRNIPALNSAVADAEDLAKVLKNEYGFSEVTLLTDANATREKIMAALSRLTDASVVRPNDRVLVFWSGHGQTVTAPEGGQIGFLLPSDAQIDFSNLDNVRPYRDSCVPMDELARLAREIPAKHVLFLVDACFSGLATTSGSIYPANTFGLLHEAYFDAKQIITASSQFEPAKEKNGHGYFTKAILDALEDPAADANKDGYLTARELFEYLRPKVQTMNANQTPRLAKFSMGIGEMLLFK